MTIPDMRKTQELNQLSVLVRAATRPGERSSEPVSNEPGDAVPVMSLLPQRAPFTKVLQGFAALGVIVDAPPSRATIAVKRLIDHGRCGILLLTEDEAGQAALADGSLREAVSILLVVDGPADRAARQELRQANRKRGVVATLMTHQITTPVLEAVIDAAYSHYWDARRGKAGSSASPRGGQRATVSQLNMGREILIGSLHRMLADHHAQAPFALYVIRIDRFRVFADLLGTRGVSLLVASVNQRLGAAIGVVDIVAYLGDGRFGVLHDGHDTEGELSERIGRAFVKAFVIAGDSFHVAPSVGVVRRGARNFGSAEDVIRDAILASEAAASAGPALEFKTSLRLEPAEDLRIEAELRAAIEQDALSIAYQPIVDLQSGTCHGFEALVRWTSETRGFISPARFVPIAEKSGLIHDLGANVLSRAGRQIAQWNGRLDASGALVMSVNVSAEQLTDARLLDDLQRVLETTGMDPSLLKLEFTETAMIQNAAQVADVLRRCKGLGVEIWVDDFGTGYSSLAHVQRFPIDGLKLDKSFVDPLDGSHAGSAMARAVMEIARILGVKVVAEGVESEAQVEELIEIGCRYAQGYFFARPLSDTDAQAFIARRPDDG